MATKNNPGKFDCHANADWDEPLFTLLARDRCAPMVVRFWALCRAVMILARAKSRFDWPMVVEAFQCARDMRAYRRAMRPRLAPARGHDATLKIKVAGQPIDIFVEYEFGHGGTDFFSGGCWHPGDPIELSILRVFVVHGPEGEERHLEAPRWLYECVEASDDVTEQIAQFHERDEPADYEWDRP